MSDFVQTMNDWRRMCESCDRNEKTGCVVNGSVCAGFRKMIDEIDLEVVEAKVTAWAAEHQEPVYPTWVEYLVGIGIIPHEIRLETADALMDTHLLKPISADIAQKLGIEPKEGNRGT